VPLQLVVDAFVVSQVSPHALQLVVDERLVSQPLVSGAAVWQSA
jgi:hypothetical protein